MGACRFGHGVQLVHNPTVVVRGAEAHLGTTIPQSRLCHFTQPQSILWQLHYAISNASRQGTMQHEKTFRMVIDTIILLDQGKIQRCNCKSKTPKAPEDFTHFFRYCG